MGPTVTGAGEAVGERRIKRRAPGAVGEREGAACGHIPHLDPGHILESQRERESEREHDHERERDRERERKEVSCDWHLLCAVGVSVKSLQ